MACAHVAVQFSFYFLAYMLDLYSWGILAVLAMSFGTGLMLSAFAGIVRYARNTAIHLGHWYSSKKIRKEKRKHRETNRWWNNAIFLP